MTDSERQHWAVVRAHINGSIVSTRAALDELQIVSPEEKTMRHYSLRLALQQAHIHIKLAAEFMAEIEKKEQGE